MHQLVISASAPLPSGADPGAQRSTAAAAAASAAAAHTSRQRHGLQKAETNGHQKVDTEDQAKTFLQLLWARTWHAWDGDGSLGNMRAMAGVAAALRVPRPLHEQPFFRYWVDFQVLSSPESAALSERALQLLGGQRTGGPPKLDPVTAQVMKIKDYGYMHMGAWDLLLSITAKAMLAAEILRPGQMVCIVPGCLCISRKTSLVRSLVMTYGKDMAFTLVPRTFKLPEELDEWGAWVQAHPEQDTGMWMLKNNKQRGTGLRLEPTSKAFDACFETTTRPGMEGLVLYRWYLAQQYITNPLLIRRRKFGVRVWALVPGVSPLRVYMHTNGLVLFSSDDYQAAEVSSSGREIARGHITNYAQNENGDVWPLSALESHLGGSRFAGVMKHIQHCVALVFASALRRIHEVQAQMDLPARSCFQFFGLDFLLDDALHPWLLEANATPSMKVEHEVPATVSVIHDQKWPVVWDMYQLLGVGPERFQKAPGASPIESMAEVEAELSRRGGFTPLMHLFPTVEQYPGLSIPWHPADEQLRAWMRRNPTYQAAIA